MQGSTFPAWQFSSDLRGERTSLPSTTNRQTTPPPHLCGAPGLCTEHPNSCHPTLTVTVIM